MVGLSEDEVIDAVVAVSDARLEDDLQDWEGLPYPVP
jgi:hypothetical protein